MNVAETQEESLVNQLLLLPFWLSFVPLGSGYFSFWFRDLHLLQCYNEVVY